MDPGAQVAVGDHLFTLLRLGSPVDRKSVVYDHLCKIGFTASDLTLLGLPREDGGDFDLHYAVWCLGAAEQKLIINEVFEKLVRAAPQAPENNEEEVELPNGRTVTIPVVPVLSAPPLPPPSKKRKVVDAVQAGVEALASGAFVLDSALLAGGQVNPALCGSRFGAAPPATATSAVMFAQMLLCMQTAPTIEQLHEWARVAVGASR
jgi:hypothetical protein